MKGDELTNSKLCRVKEGGRIIEYTPFEVTEYGFSDGRVFISKEITAGASSEKVFMQRLQQGKATLYYYRGEGVRTFYIEKDSSLFMELPKQNGKNEKFSEQLLLLTSDCSAVSDADRLVGYNKNSLSRLIQRYNNCDPKPFPHFKYGMMAGLEFLRLLPVFIETSDLVNFNFRYDGGSSLAVFIDNPVLVSDFSLHAEVSISKHGYSYNRLLETADMDYVANITSVKVPVLLRYTLPSEKISPFFNVGLAAAFNIKNESLFYKDIIDGKTIELTDAVQPLLNDDFQAGYSAGSGIEYRLNYRKALLFELRYTRLYNQSPLEGRGSSGISFTTGITF